LLGGERIDRRSNVGALELPHLLVILLIVVVVFGVGRLGEVGEALGKGIREFKKASLYDPTDELRDAKPQETAGASPAPVQVIAAAKPAVETPPGVVEARPAVEAPARPPEVAEAKPVPEAPARPSQMAEAAEEDIDIG
jgi:sec-independent protein translocase protein TatA